MSQVEERLGKLGIAISEVPIPIAAYVPGLVVGNMVYTSGQLPMVSGQLAFKGRIGENADVEDGYAAARQCAVNCLGVKVVGFVNSTPDFEMQPKVINGASELLQEAFGDAGSHARSAVGVAALPLGAMCEVEIIAEFR